MLLILLIKLANTFLTQFALIVSISLNITISQYHSVRSDVRSFQYLQHCASYVYDHLQRCTSSHVFDHHQHHTHFIPDRHQTGKIIIFTWSAGGGGKSRRVLGGWTRRAAGKHIELTCFDFMKWEVLNAIAGAGQIIIIK